MHAIHSFLNFFLKKDHFSFNLKERDSYTLYSFAELQQERFAKDLDYYICVVKQNGWTYLFDASSFLEDFFRKEKKITNPINKQPIDDFEIYVSSKEHPDFQLYMKKNEVIEYPHYQPIFWSDLSKDLSIRMRTMLDYGNFLEEKDIKKAIKLYKKTAEMGSTKAKVRLATQYIQLGKKRQGMKWLKETLSSGDISMKQIFFCAQKFEDYQDDAMSFKAYTLAAKKESFIGIGQVISSLELGIGTKKNPQEALQWRIKLPKNWQQAPISDFFKHLKKIGYGYDSVGYDYNSDGDAREPYELGL